MARSIRPRDLLSIESWHSTSTDRPSILASGWGSINEFDFMTGKPVNPAEAVYFPSAMRAGKITGLYDIDNARAKSEWLYKRHSMPAGPNPDNNPVVQSRRLRRGHRQFMKENNALQDRNPRRRNYHPPPPHVAIDRANVDDHTNIVMPATGLKFKPVPHVVKRHIAARNARREETARANALRRAVRHMANHAVRDGLRRGLALRRNARAAAGRHSVASASGLPRVRGRKRKKVAPRRTKTRSNKSRNSAKH